MDILKIYESIVLENEELEEAGLAIGNQAYPKSDQILIMAGGAGSGKSFILDKLLLFEGKVLNPDNTLMTMLKMGRKHPDSEIAKKFKETTGKELKDMDLGRPQDVSAIHDFISKLKYHRKMEWCFFNSVAESSIKPNVVFDIQMRDLDSVKRVADYAKIGGYKPENIHVVWVLNEFKIALEQNAKRERKIDPGMLEDFHIGVAETFKDLIDYTDEWKDQLGGDIWIVFNKKGVDIQTVLTVGEEPWSTKNRQKVTVNLDPDAERPYLAVQMKERGKPAKKWSQVDEEILRKIRRYVPKDVRKELFK